APFSIRRQPSSQCVSSAAVSICGVAFLWLLRAVDPRTENAQRRGRTKKPGKERGARYCLPRISDTLKLDQRLRAGPEERHFGRGYGRAKAGVSQDHTTIRQLAVPGQHHSRLDPNRSRRSFGPARRDSACRISSGDETQLRGDIGQALVTSMGFRSRLADDRFRQGETYD